MKAALGLEANSTKQNTQHIIKSFENYGFKKNKEYSAEGKSLRIICKIFLTSWIKGQNIHSIDK